MMFRPPHSIRKQIIELTVDSEALALALQPRMGDVNRRHFLPVIRRVLEELDVPGRQIKIDRLEINLGLLPLNRFEEEAAERLYHELSRALKEVLRDAGTESTRGSRSQPEAASRLEALEQYLLRGTLPFWAARAADSSIETFVLELAEEDPVGLVSLIRRLGRRSRVLERIVLSFGESLLRGLLRLLEPKHAALILIYMIDLREVHRIEPVLALGETAFARMIWLLILAYIVRDPGSQFNRKSFVKSLLEGMSESEGLSYVEILRTLRLALRETGHKQSLQSSLPAVINELVGELNLEAVVGKGKTLSVTRHARALDEAGDEAATAHATGDELFDAQDELFDKAAEKNSIAATMEASAPIATTASATDLMQASNPHLSADDALVSLEHYLTASELAEASAPPFKGQAPVLDMEGRLTREEAPDLRGLLRLLAIHDASRAAQLIRRVALLQVPGRAVIIERLLGAFSPDELLAVLMPEHARDIIMFVEVLCGIRAHGVPTASAAREHTIRQAVLEALLGESPGNSSLTTVVRRVFERWARRLGGSASTFADALVRAPGLNAPKLGDALARALKELTKPGRPRRPHTTALARSLFARYDLLEVLRYYLDHGMLPWGALLRDPALTIESAAASLPVLSRSMLRRLLASRNRAEQMRAILLIVEALPDDGFAKLLLRLLPRAGGDDNPLLSSLQAFASECGNKQTFYARLIAAILDGQPLDLEELSASGPAPPRAAELILPANPDDWNAHLLKSAIANRLRFGDGAGAGGHTQADLLRALVVHHPVEACHFLGAVGRARGPRAAFVRQCPSTLFDRVLRLLYPGGAESLNALTHSFARIPAPYRPFTDEDIRRVFLEEVLRARVGELLTPSFFVRVLRRLFAAPLSERVSELLLREGAAWPFRVELSAEHAAAFEAAVKTVAAGGTVRAGTSDADNKQHVFAMHTAHATRDAVFAFLLGESRAPRNAEVDAHGPAASRQEALKRDVLLYELNLMLEESPAEVYDFISQHLSDALMRENWVKLLPESTLVRMSYLLEPRRHRALLDAVEVLGSAWSESAPPSHPSLAGREVCWSLLLEFLAKNAETNRSTERFVSAFFEYYAARYLTASPSAPDHAAVGANMLEHAAHLARAGGHASLLSLLQRNRSLLLLPWESSAPAPRPPASDSKTASRRSQEAEALGPGLRRNRTRTAFGMVDDKEDAATGETIYVSNAGLVLTGAFLPTFFQSLDLLSHDERGVVCLRNRGAASRAVHLLQYFVEGRTSAPEPLLVLNKILCGLPTSTPVEKEIEMSETEREACERLLKSMIANWKIIENTSIAGLQETFLQREGRLERSDTGWELRVQRKTLDVLVDQIPWSISVVYQRWMPQPLYVKW